EDKGQHASLERAAAMVAAAKGMGFAGVHLGGMTLCAADVEEILKLAEQYEPNWQEHVKAALFGLQSVSNSLAGKKPHTVPAFYRYRLDETTGLTLDEQYDLVEEDKRTIIKGNYALSRAFHKGVFMPHRGINSLFIKTEQSLQKKQGHLRSHTFEHVGKACLYGCMDCGDCGLAATAYSCPMASCPKNQRNGACGGSKDGFCEAYPGERYCIWYKAYHRLKPYGEQDKLGSYIMPPNDWSNFTTSPWGNNALGKDAYARREFLPGIEPDIESKEGPRPDAGAPRIY
ncbi:MAG: methylenetetrahydrofolate reductase C-terminal domain-containing protein, partial [Eggerthellaceae bacterium]|nr:methylenetetrahydrofolate reductase C-terminal domain-containing protein [Eggerthellaceae bacterium]